jgi:hypothetical protein
MTNDERRMTNDGQWVVEFIIMRLRKLKDYGLFYINSY